MQLIRKPLLHLCHFSELPHATEIDRRNRALIAFTLTTSVSDGARASLKLKHVDLAAAKVLLDAGGKYQVLQDLHDMVFPGGR